MCPSCNEIVQIDSNPSRVRGMNVVVQSDPEQAWDVQPRYQMWVARSLRCRNSMRAYTRKIIQHNFAVYADCIFRLRETHRRFLVCSRATDACHQVPAIRNTLHQIQNINVHIHYYYQRGFEYHRAAPSLNFLLVAVKEHCSLYRSATSLGFYDRLLTPPTPFSSSLSWQIVCWTICL